MAHYIDADRLIAEFQKRFKKCKKVSEDDRNALDTREWYRGKYTAYSEVLSFISFLQQEQKESLHIAETCKENTESFTDEDEGYLNVAIRSIECDFGEDSDTVRWLKALPGRINSQPKQGQPDFPTTDEEVEKALSTIPKAELPDKYKTFDWLFEKHEHPGVDLEKEIEREWQGCHPVDEGMGVEMASIHIEAFEQIARYFFGLGLRAKEESK